MAVEFTPLPVRETTWDPAAAEVALNARLDARLVPSGASPDGLRLAYSHVVVLDRFFGEDERVALLNTLTQPGWDHAQGPPLGKWERETADGAGRAKTWGLRDDVIASLARQPIPAMLEVHARLAKLYPDVTIAHMPSDAIQAPPARMHSIVPDSGVAGPALEADDGGHGAAEEEPIDCALFVGNAAVYGDTYTWHVDADPATFPASPWTAQFGDYCNGEPGAPLFVSLLLYLDADWAPDWAADTLFLDGDTDVGLLVRPKRFRAILMDQDVVHRVSTPSPLAGGRPRYSLVWKLVFLPRSASQACCLAQSQWGPPTDVGSAAKMRLLKRRLMNGRPLG